MSQLCKFWIIPPSNRPTTNKVAQQELKTFYQKFSSSSSEQPGLVGGRRLQKRIFINTLVLIYSKKRQKATKDLSLMQQETFFWEDLTKIDFIRYSFYLFCWKLQHPLHNGVATNAKLNKWEDLILGRFCPRLEFKQAFLMPFIVPKNQRNFKWFYARIVMTQSRLFVTSKYS